MINVPSEREWAEIGVEVLIVLPARDAAGGRPLSGLPPPCPQLLPGLDSKYAGLLELQYSIVFNPNSIFGSRMDDGRSLASYGVLHDDILNLRYDKPGAEAAAQTA